MIHFCLFRKKYTIITARARKTRGHVCSTPSFTSNSFATSSGSQLTAGCFVRKRSSFLQHHLRCAHALGLLACLVKIRSKSCDTTARNTKEAETGFRIHQRVMCYRYTSLLQKGNEAPVYL